MSERAFPAVRLGLNPTELGMTLRDYFAAKAMQSLLSAWITGELDDDSWVGDHRLARESYAIADAMLEARK